MKLEYQNLGEALNTAQRYKSFRLSLHNQRCHSSTGDEHLFSWAITIVISLIISVTKSNDYVYVMLLW